MAVAAPPIAIEALADAVAGTLGLERAVVAADFARAAEDARRQRALTDLQAWARDVQTLKTTDLPDLLVRGQQAIDTLRTHGLVPGPTSS
jgi:hypothetical protein